MVKKLTVIFILVLISLMFSQAIEKKPKTIIFSHALHLSDEERNCSDCHSRITQSTKADEVNLPAKAECANCHDVEDESQCGSCHPDAENPQTYVIEKRHYYFNHQIHEVQEKLTCERCHAAVRQDQQAEGVIPSRTLCNQCHNGFLASMSCYECHPPESKFSPEDHTMNWMRDHAFTSRLGTEDCVHCHTNDYCQGCHEVKGLISTASLPQHVYPPYDTQVDGKQGLSLKMVHGFNYRDVHQIEAYGKDRECRVCHETSNYCVECHQQKDALRPYWHGGVDWGALATGVGSGGGRHAALARRDIERCAACHDVQGADPTCLQCHSDFDGIRHTNPKTHASGLSNKFSGVDFHHDEGAICFTCHIHTHQKGIGFCGYCHE